ncbi:hypothetical protein [Streptomyces sp. NPDC046887]|uniref:hypothetical protein n=1 Tax=Streptomyces sp. NPDC046887 TaxID=3155472 RepID=UPI00340FFB04
MNARLRYLDSHAGRQALKDAGVSPRTLRDWKSGRSTPSAASRKKIDNAYWTRRRENVLRSGWLKRHLNNDGAGRRVEIHAVDQSGMDPKHRRNLSDRTPTVRYVWDDLVDAYAAQDEDAVDEIWEDIISDLDSDWNAYAYVSSVGIAA